MPYRKGHKGGVNSDDLLIDGAEGAPRTLVLAHGAGAPMDSPYMAYFAERLAGPALRVVRFEFPYMRARREGGGRKPPDREAVLLETWREVVRTLGKPEETIIGGKSMGGRMASMVADELGVRGLVCLGYPFHAPGRPEKPRIEHLRDLRTPALIVQGTRDPFGSPDEVAGYGLAEGIRVRWLEDGDHDLKPRKTSGRTQRELWDEAIAVLREFVAEL